MIIDISKLSVEDRELYQNINELLGYYKAFAHNCEHLRTETKIAEDKINTYCVDCEALLYSH